MKTLKSYLSIGLAFIALNVSASKKSDIDVQKFAEIQTGNIMSHVKGVNSDQENKIFLVEQASDNALLDARNNNNGNSDAIRIKMNSIRADRDTKIKAILSADQFVQYQKMQEELAAARIAK